MKERKGLSESASNTLKVIVILLFFVGAVIFWKKVWVIEFEHTWKHWIALALGELSYLYSFTFLISGIGLIIAYFDDKENNDWGGKGGLMCLCSAVIVQCVFWGTVFLNKDTFKCAALLTVITGFMGRRLRKSSEKKQ